MNTHALKCWPEYFEKVLDGSKTFEIRDNKDRNFQVGDILELGEFIPCKTCGGTGRYAWDAWDNGPCSCKPPRGEYTGKVVRVRVSYITDFNQKEGYVVMAIKKI